MILVSVAPIADQQARRTSLLLRPAADRFTSRFEQLIQRRDADTADRRVASDNPGTVVFDPADVLCDQERCSVVRGGVQIYTNQNHLSRPGALLLEAPFREALKRAAALGRESASART